MDRATPTLSAVMDFIPTPPDLDSESEDDDKNVVERLKALPSVGMALLVPPSRDQDELLQKTLDKYKVTVEEAISDPRALLDGFGRGLSYSCQVFFPKVPLVPRWIPAVPLISSYFLGAKYAAVILTGLGIGAGGIGFFSGLTDKARELHQKTPEDNLRVKKESLEQSVADYKKEISDARGAIVREKKNWHQIEPRKKIDEPKKVLEGIKETLFWVHEKTKDTSVRFYEKEIEAQAKLVQEVKESRVRLKNSKPRDDNLQFFRAEINLEIENEALNRLRACLENAKAAPIQDESGHIERQEEVSEIMTKSKFQALNEIYQRYLKAESQLKSAESDMLRVCTELVSVCKDEQQILLARQRGMTPVKEDKAVFLDDVADIAGNTHTSQLSGSRST